jgi:serine/threonine protein kinase
LTVLSDFRIIELVCPNICAYNASGNSHVSEAPMQQEKLILPVGVTIRDPAGGRYVIVGLLGEGGSGAVYLVQDQRVKQRLFALKEVINPDKHERQRFTFEGEVLGRLQHRSLPHVYRVFENDKLKRVYMLMDYIEGRNLEALQKGQPEQCFTLPLALSLMSPIVDALNYLHHQEPPIIHRDVKPANIIVPVRGERAVLVDFGIAKEYVIDGTTNVIRHGSPGYAAPEQYGGGTNPRTDLYGLGATFYTLLTGITPPDAITRATSSRKADPLAPANMLTSTVPRAVAEAIGRAMSISIDDRFETVEQFWQELNGDSTEQQIYLTNGTSPDHALFLPEQNREGIVTDPWQQGRPTLRTGRRSRLIATLVGLLIMLALAVSFLLYLSQDFGSSVALHGATPSSSHTSTVTTVVSSPISKPTPVSSIYPSLSSSYAGTIVDLLAGEKTPMYLANVQQSRGRISGTFQGLGLVGTFSGTITSSGKVHFTMMNSSTNQTLAFEGTIKTGGDIVGTFSVLDQNGYQTGESGLWNLASNP